MKLIDINKKIYTVPEQWNELSQKQLIQIMDCLFMKQYTTEEVELKLLKILTNMSYWEFFRATPHELQEYLYLTQFLFNDQKDLTKQLIPEYDDLYGPAGEFDNLLMKELAICDIIFLQWSADRENEEHLNYFVALLYRPAKKRKGLLKDKKYDFKRNPDGDPREDFNQNVAQYWAEKKIRHWPISVKLAIAYWYDACRWKLVDDNEEVFGDSSGDPSKYGLASLMLSVASDGALGDFTKVENTYVHIVLMQINESMRRAKEQEKLLKK
jgi:hypothetical protein